MMSGQEGHFGTDLALDAPTAATVLAFLVRNAAENSSTEAAFKINRSIPPGVTPLRITEPLTGSTSTVTFASPTGNCHW
jgi:hypothetical protein